MRHFVVIDFEDPFIDDLIYPVDTEQEIEIAKAAMEEYGLTELPVLTGDPDSNDVIRTSLVLWPKEK